MDMAPLTEAIAESQLSAEELQLALRAHLLAAMRGDQTKISKLRDEALTAFYVVIGANEQAAHTIRKLQER